MDEHSIEKGEVWKEVPSFTEYEVSDFGRVRRKAHIDRDGRQRKERYLKQAKIHIDKGTAENRMARGPYIRVREDSLIYTVSVASLVYEAFVGPFDHRRYRIGFKNGDPMDVRLENITREKRGEFSTRKGLLNRLRKLRQLVD